MKTQEKIEKKGYKVTYNIGWRNGIQSIVSVTATRGTYKVTERNITSLFRALS